MSSDVDAVSIGTTNTPYFKDEPEDNILTTNNVNTAASTYSVSASPVSLDTKPLSKQLDVLARPKKPKPPRRATVEEPNLCGECKTTDSKLWRRGPAGLLMCNACGLRWKRSKKPKPESPSVKAIPRKRKLPPVTVNTQTTNQMSLPTSSMAAVKRGTMYKHAFPTSSSLCGSLAASQKDFVYQPQNMFLHQQQQLAQAAQYHEQRLNQTAAVTDLVAARLAAEHKDTSIDQELEDQIQSLEHSPLLPSTQRDSDVPEFNPTISPQAAESQMASLTSLTNFEDSEEQIDARPHDPDDSKENGHSHIATQDINLHGVSARESPTQVPVDESLHIIDEHSQSLMLPHEDHQTDDFSSLLSLKAFVDDAVRPF